MARRKTTSTQAVRFGIAVVVCVSVFVGFPDCESARADDDSATAPATDLSVIDVLIDWGMHALETNRFREAEARFREVLDRDWNHPRAYSLLQKARAMRARQMSEWQYSARKAMANDQWERALVVYERILDEDSLNEVALDGVRWVKNRRRVAELVRAGLERFIMGNYAEAHDDFERALRINPADSTAAVYAQRAEQETEQSTSLADLRSDGDAWDTYLDALKHFRAGELSRAEALWREILEQYPGNEAVLSNLDQVLRRKKGEISAQDLSP
ncbi:MAG: tetratricopeptide repeat protein [candidate division Zixibacteria bacterium]|nr:tetratricopeptide repeat protein [candidate division Zixibacteria bacterium]